jgi:hypothetical protein
LEVAQALNLNLNRILNPFVRWYVSGSHKAEPSRPCDCRDVVTANHREKLEAVCHVIASELEDLARQRCRAEISEEQFINRVLEIEAREVTPHQLTLTAAHTRESWTVFTLKMNGTNEICASFEFSPETHQLRRRCADCDAA